MVEYRTGTHWGRTIIRAGVQPADATGKRPDDQLVGTMDDPELAERICSLLNFQERAMEIWGPTDGDILAQSKSVAPADSCICPDPVCPRHGAVL